MSDSGKAGENAKPRTRLATRIAFAASTLTLAFVLVVGAISYFVTRSQITQGVESTLDNHASLVAGRLGSTLSAVVNTLSPLAQNALILNALMDSLTRDTSLKPFLADFSTVNGVPVQISLTDFEGNVIAGSQPHADDTTSWKAPVLGEGAPYATIEKEGSHVHLIVAEPVFYLRTLSPEGALIHAIDLDQVIADIDPENVGSIRLLQKEGPIWQYSAGGESRKPADPPTLTRTHPLDVPEILAPLGLAVEVSARPGVVRGLLDNLYLTFVLLGFLVLVAVIILSAIAARHLARPLRELEQVAVKVVESGSFEHHFAAGGYYEVFRLGEAFNRMLERLGEAYEQLAKLAHQDTLTGLANRALFQRRLREELRNVKRSQEPLAILLLDLDDFKDVNDTLGHPIGDELLKQVAGRLRDLLRTTDTVARLGGDEFAVIGTHLCDAKGAASLGQKILASMSQPFHIADHKIFVNASTGIAVCPTDGEDPDQLLKNADLALYQAKGDGKGRLHFYDLKLNAQVQERKRLEALIRAALNQSGFCLHYQPKVNLHTGELTGVEALLRWCGPGESVSPGVFVPIAETTQLIIPLGEWVFREACSQRLAWKQLGLPSFPVAVNLSAVQLRHDSTVQRLAEVIEEIGIEPGDLEIEITESALMEKPDSMARRLGIFHELGIGLAIDDIGTGYSSLSNIKRLSVDVLKIDRSFVRDIELDENDAAITKAIIQLGSSLGLTVVAEGVENQGQAEFLIRHGCQQAQGFYYSPARSGESLVSWLRGRASLKTNSPFCRIGGRSE